MRAPTTPPAWSRPWIEPASPAQTSSSPSTEIGQRQRPDDHPAALLRDREPAAACARPRTAAGRGRSARRCRRPGGCPRRAPRPTGPPAPNQTATMPMTPKVRTASAAPSRRCVASRSRAVAALRPIARVALPTSVASPRQIAASARQTPIADRHDGDDERDCAGGARWRATCVREVLRAAGARPDPRRGRAACAPVHRGTTTCAYACWSRSRNHSQLPPGNLNAEVEPYRDAAPHELRPRPTTFRAVAWSDGAVTREIGVRFR